MSGEVLVAGGGIGALAAAVAASRIGWQARVYEQAAQFSEVGAGIQLGPNAVRLLQAWGLERALDAVVARPRQLRARCALGGHDLGALRLDRFAARYGAPYLTVHRADLHALLLAAARQAGAHLHTGARVTAIESRGEAVSLTTDGGLAPEGDVLVGADGLWSTVRALVVGDGPPAATGHLAFRGLAPMAGLPAWLREPEVTAWLGPKLHVVAYPVRCGELLNVVAVVEGSTQGGAADWDQAATAAQLAAATGATCAPLQELLQGVPAWRLWMLHARAPVAGAHQMAAGRVALLGDAAHPMKPYLAQGAAMAIEDAQELSRMLAMADEARIEVPLAISRYALNRWQRCARVQQRSQRNGRVFHATGLVRAARDASLRLAGPLLMDQPWLYRGISSQIGP